MHISNTFIASLSLGLIAGLNSVVAAGDSSRIRTVELSDSEQFVTLEIKFSDDGSTIIARQNEFADQRILVHDADDQQWNIAIDYQGKEWTGTPTITGVSADGSVFVVTDNSGSVVSRDGVLSEVPDVWVDDQGQLITDGQVYVRSLSRDGQTLGLAGSSRDVRGTDALIWNDIHGMMNLNIGFTDDGTSHQILSMNTDGSAIAGSSAYLAQTNNYRQFYGYHDAWVLNSSGFTLIPPPKVGEDVVMKVVDVSDDGQVVVGINTAPLRYHAHLQQVGVTTLLLQPTLSWIWTPQFGTELIGNPERYTNVNVTDLSGAGDVVLGYGYGSDVSEQFLWTRADGAVPIWDVLASRGIENNHYFHAESISDDGQLLMGWGYDELLSKRFIMIIDISE